MQRLRSPREETPSATAGQPASKTRADTLSQAAEAAKRGADAFLDREQARGRGIAAMATASGLLSLGFAGTVALGYGNPHVIGLLAGLAALAPTALALARTADADPRMREAGIDRGLCQAVSAHARRLGDSVGATDERNIALGPEAIVNGQLDVLYKDLDRSRQRLAAAGAEVGNAAKVNRLHERLVPDQAETVVTTEEGRRYPAWIAELSQTGVTLRGNLPPIAPADTIQVGARKARLTGTAGNRASFVFMTPLVMSEFTRKIVL